MNDDEQTKIRTSQDTLNHAAQNSAPSPAIGADAQTRRPLFENYRSCLDAIPDLVALKGTDLEYLFVNRAYCDLLGKRRDDILGKRATEIFSQDVARKLEIMDLLVLAGADKSVEEVRIDNRIFEIRKFPVSIDEEGLVVTAGRDITERKSAEEDLLSKKIRFQIMSDNSPLAMALLDGDGHVDYVNTRFKEIFGYDSDEIRDGATWFRRVFPGREYEREIASILQRPQDVEGWAERERRVLTAVCRNGTQKILSLEAVQLTSGDMVVSCDAATGRIADEAQVVLRADYDALTGLPNESSLERGVGNLVDHAREGRKRGGWSALLLFAIHDLEKLRTAYGGAAGDEILVVFGKLLKSILRTGDTAYRSGDNQFAVVFKGISLAEAKLAAERIHHATASFTFLPGTGDIRIDVAGALVQVDGKNGTTQILSAARSALERAMRRGRNQMVVHEWQKETP